MNIDELKQRALVAYPEITTLSAAEQILLDTYLKTHRVRISYGRVQRPQEEIERDRVEWRRLYLVLSTNRQIAQQWSITSEKQAVGFLRIEDIRPAYPELTEEQVERVRKRLEEWRKLHEDSVLTYNDDAPEKRPRYAYPAEVVREKVTGVLEKEKRLRDR